MNITLAVPGRAGRTCERLRIESVEGSECLADDGPCCLYILSVMFAGTAFNGEQGGEPRIHAVDNSCCLRGLCSFGAQDVNFFVFLDTVTQSLESDGAAIAGIDQEAITCCPVAEVGVLQRVAVP